MRRTLLVFVAMLSTNACAADWELFDKKNGVTSYIDRDSQRRDEDRTGYSAWLKSVYDKPQKLSQKGPGNEYVQKMELVHMHCSDRNYFIEKVVYSAKDGTPVISKKIEGGSGVVVPESPSETRYIELCKKPFSAIRELSNRGIYYKPLKEEPKPKWWNPFAK